MTLPTGITVHGPADSVLVRHVHAQLVRALVMRTITCPRTGEVLDVRTCVVLLDRDGDPAHVMSQRGWAEILIEGQDVLLEQEHGIVADPSTVKGK